MDDDPLLEAFRDAWEQCVAGARQARPVLAEHLHRNVPAVAQQTRFRALLEIDVGGRRRLQEQPCLNDYLPRHPEYDALLREHFSIGRASDRVEGDDEESARTLPSSPSGTPLLLQPGERLGGYRIKRLIGEGSFAQVYEAEDIELPRSVAIKLPRPEAMADVEVYRREARNLASLEHPAIVRVLHVGEDNGQFFLVTEYVEGGDLKAFCQAHAVSHRDAAALIRDVAHGLQHAHQKGFIHRDLKPANILISGEHGPRIADFGLAMNYADFGKGPRLAGSVPYMSPEQARLEGHRVDGRSDIFSLGTMLYELLAGCRPFAGDRAQETMDQIVQVDPRPLRQIDQEIPRELERVCMKALAKRATERYSCAQDMADDLSAWLSPFRAEQPSAEATTDAPVMPKGLRSFAKADADFFLRLLPGPVDREGLPESIRFWKQRIDGDAHAPAFDVGVVYGPSGSGKSSLIRAGLVPRLASHVVTIHIEATTDATEADLLRQLTEEFVGLAGETSLATALTRLRREDHLGGRKLLLVIDQFEQWLHGSSSRSDQLARALRQCDGRRAQCLLIIRDDFWPAVSRFAKELEITLRDDNSLQVELFDRGHARTLLRLFGVAYGRLPADPRDESRDQRRFVDQAAAMLAQDGRVVPVQLAMLVEMLKGEPWTTATLSQLGGATGIGVAFLESTFQSVATLAKHRMHREPATAVLEALLPQSAGPLKGHHRSRSELQAVCGYDDEDEFDALLEMLDELRLITPVDSLLTETALERKGPTSEQSYQLTHDYLVPSLRDWLASKKVTTRNGRAQLLLDERAAQWSVTRDRRLLPSLREWLAIQIWTERGQRDGRQSAMMDIASRYHATRLGIFVSGTLLACGVAFFAGDQYLMFGAGALLAFAAACFFGEVYFRAVQASPVEPLVEKLLVAAPEEVPQAIDDLRKHGDSARNLLRLLLPSLNGRKRVHADLALLPDSVHSLAAAMLTDEGDDDSVAYFSLVCDQLRPFAAELVKRVGVAFEDPQQPRQARFRAAVALLRWGNYVDRRAALLDHIGRELVHRPAQDASRWASLVRDISGMDDALLQQLRAKSDNPALRDSCWRLLASSFADRTEVLVELIVHATASQLTELTLAQPTSTAPTSTAPTSTAPTATAPTATGDEGFGGRLAERREQLAAAARRERDALRARIDELSAADSQRDACCAELERAQAAADASCANLTLALLEAGRTDLVWPALRRPLAAPTAAEAGLDLEVGARSELISRWGRTGIGVPMLAERLLHLSDAWQRGEPSEVSELRALLLTMGIAVAGGHATLSSRLSAAVAALQQRHTDAGVHSAAAWLVRRSGGGQRPTASPKTDPPLSAANWRQSSSGIWLAQLGPASFSIGSPAHERHRETDVVEMADAAGAMIPTPIELQRSASVARFSIGMQLVSVEQYQQLTPHYKGSVQESISRSVRDPAHWVSWREAAQFCNRLSEAEGIAESEWSYSDQTGEFDLTKPGYRLPTSAEWEYACRAGAETARFFGDSPTLLTEYAWFLDNSGKESYLPCGELMPNDFGLFDMLGNVAELCADAAAYDGVRYRIARGGSYGDVARLIRCAQVLLVGESEKEGRIGFRIAKTEPAGGPQ